MILLMRSADALKLAQNQSLGTRSFSAFASARILLAWAHPCSTETRSQVNYRYPSPLKRFALSGGPLFSESGAPGEGAVKPGPVADFMQSARLRHYLVAQNKNRASMGGTSKHPAHLTGEDQCEEFSSALGLSPSSARFRPVTTTQSAAWLELLRAARWLTRRVATLLRAPSWAVLRASSATTLASASKTRAAREGGALKSRSDGHAAFMRRGRFFVCATTRCRPQL